MSDKEIIEKLKKENQELRKQCMELKEQCQELKDEIAANDEKWYNIFSSKQTAYMDLIAENTQLKAKKELMHNARGAGRKRDIENINKQLSMFENLYNRGLKEKEIIKEMGISRSTYYRIKKRYIKRKETHKEMYMD